MIKTTMGQLAVNHGIPKELRNYSATLDKKGLDSLLKEVVKLGPEEYRDTVQHLSRVGRHIAEYTGGNSFGPEHLQLSVAGKLAQVDLNKKVRSIYADKKLSDDQKEEQVVQLLTDAGPKLTDDVMKESLSEHNPLAMQILSGSRGNPTNLRSLRAGDLLYVDHRNRPIPVPILHSYAQGLSPVEYFAGTFGARKGVLSAKFCLSASTKVLMADYSEKEISAVVPSDWVMGANTNGEIFPVKVLRHFNNGDRLCYRFLFRKGSSRAVAEIRELVATEDHEILAFVTKGANEKDRIESGNGEVVKIPLRKARFRQDSTKNCFIARPVTGNCSTAGVDEPMALMAGLMLGDGCMAPSTHGTYTFSCNDQLLLNDIRDYFAEFNLKLVRTCSTQYSYSLSQIEKPKRRTEFVNNRTRFLPGMDNQAKVWLKTNLGEKLAHDKRLPENIWGWNNASIAKLLGGLFVTDGSVIDSDDCCTIKIGLTSESIIQDVKKLLELRFGIWVSKVSVVPKESKENATHDQFYISFSNMELIRRFAESIPLFGKKRLLLQSVIDSNPTAFRFGFKAIQKTKLGYLPTCDIEVDHPDHLFVLANGLIVGNSTRDSGYLSKQMTQASHRLVVSDLDRDDDDKTGELRGLPVKIDDPHNEGALLAMDIGPYKRNTILTPKVIDDLRNRGFVRMLVRSPLVGGHPNGGLYARDLGIREKGTLPPTGDFVGISAAQALCLDADTEVRMANHSVKKISELQPGDTVMGCNIHGCVKPVKVTHLHDNGKREVYETVFRLGTGKAQEENLLKIRSTLNHKLLAATIVNHATDGRPTATIRPIGHTGNDELYAVTSDSCGRELAEQYKLISQELIGIRPVFDITVDNEDHLFLLKNGLIVSNSEPMTQSALNEKHSGGVSKGDRPVGPSGFELIDQYVQVPKTFKGGASHAQDDGVVSSIQPAPQGGTYLIINGKQHYIGRGYNPIVKVGQEVEAGDSLSDGLPNPAEVVQHKGTGEGSRYFTDAFVKAYQDSNIPVHRRNVEVLARALIDHVEMDDEYADHLPGDVVSYNTLEHKYEPRPGHQVIPVSYAKNQYLEKPVLHYSIGTKIRPSVINTLNEFGVKSVTVHKEPPPFHPRMIRGMENLTHDPDWLTKFLGSYLKKNFLASAHRGAVSDEQGTSFVPSLARGINFGKQSPVKGWATSGPTPTAPVPAPSILAQMEDDTIKQSAAGMLLNKTATFKHNVLVKQAEEEIFKPLRKEFDAGHTVDLDDGCDDDDYPVSSITYHVEHHRLPTHRGEDGEELAVLQGSDSKGKSGSFEIIRPGRLKHKTKFFRHCTEEEQDRILQEFSPLMPSMPKLHKSNEELLDDLRKFEIKKEQ